MQIGDSAYLEIKVKGSNREGIVAYDMLKRFQLVETAGASLPYICFSFATFDESLANLFIENNEVLVTIGETKEKASTFSLHAVTNTKDTDPSNNSWTIYYGGFIGSSEFMMNKGICKEYAGNSLMVIKEVIKNYAGGSPEIDTDIEKTNENQVLWRQLYTTPNVFLIDTILHMDIQPSFPLFTFDRFGKFHIRDFNKLRSSEPKYYFVPYPARMSNEIQYFNNFNIQSYKTSYNLYSGYDKVTEIYGSASGSFNLPINSTEPILSATQEAEHNPSGNRMSLNKIQSDNVHHTYMEAFAHNTNCLMSLSSMLGCVQIAGYHTDIMPTDLVFVKTGKQTLSDLAIEGKYLVDTVVTSLLFEHKMVSTLVYVTRDNSNNIENFIAEKRSNYLKIRKKFMEALASAAYQARTVLTAASQLFDGTFIRACLNYITASKVNLLRMFSLGGNMMDFTSQVNFLQSLLFQGNTLMNALMNMIFPSSIALMMRDFVIESPSKRTLLSKYISENVPFEVQGLVSEVVDALLGVHDSLNSIAQDNGMTAREVAAVPEENLAAVEEENRLNAIFQQFENNTTGLDIPFPIIELTEEQKLLPTDELTTLVATETISNLTNLGYMTGVDTGAFQDILLGKTPINFDIINQINENAGDKFNYRYWGTYGASGDSLYAWSINDKTIYTKSAELSIYTRLYNQDASPYMGVEFS